MTTLRLFQVKTDDGLELSCVERGEARGVPMIKMPAHVWREVAHGLMAEDFSAELRRIAVPMLIIWGDRDGFGDRHEQVALEVALRHARSSVFADIGHAPHWEAPERVAAQIAAFVASALAPVP